MDSCVYWYVGVYGPRLWDRILIDLVPIAVMVRMCMRLFPATRHDIIVRVEQL